MTRAAAPRPRGLFAGQIPLMRPWLGPEEDAAVLAVLRSGWISQGPRTLEFERRFARYVGAKHAVATNSCTAALHLSLLLKGIGPGDEVICPSFTCMATANAIHLCGAEPVFADIDPRTYNLDAESVLARATARTRALLIVHQIGLPADRAALAALARRRRWVVVEDAACSLGASIGGRRLGGHGAPTAFSFHPRKVITTGEGGMLTTDDGALAERARELRSAGASISDLERHRAKGTLVQSYARPGFNYRMTDLQAAIGLVQLGKVDAILAERRAQARVYDEALAGVEEVSAPYVPPGAAHAYSSYLIRLGPRSRISRDELLRAMARRSVSCRVGIQPLHREPLYRRRDARLRLPATEAAAASTLFLPIFPGLDPRDQGRVVAALKDAVCRSR